jgi:hypothetical protein
MHLLCIYLQLLIFIHLVDFNYVGTYQNDGALVTMRTKDGSGKGGKAALYVKCAEALNDEFASLPVKCDPVKAKNKIHLIRYNNIYICDGS